MGSDMVVALARTTRDGRALFGHNSTRPVGEGQALCRAPGRAFARGETVVTTNLVLPQAARTHTVLGCRAAGVWGYQHGVNQHGVALGTTPVHTKLLADGPGLTGPDLVRLGLERAASALQAVDVLTELVTRYGQGPYAGCPAEEDHDNAFLIADAREAFVLEACGPYWGMQRVGEVRAVTDVCGLRQDWDRIARGLSALAIGKGWWPEDGSKLDFAGALAPAGVDGAPALRRWGRATLLLEEHNGQIDTAFLRRLLSDHHEGDALLPSDTTLCQHATVAPGEATAASLVAQLGPEDEPLPVMWCGFGPPCSTVYLPLFLDGELPEAFQAEGPRGGCAVWRWMKGLRGPGEHLTEVREQLAGLQVRFDQESRDFQTEAAILKHHGDADALHRLATSFMQHNVEAFASVCEEFGQQTGKAAAGWNGVALEAAYPG
jgi:dipeptidase